MELIPAFIRRRIAHRPKLLKIVDNIGWLFFDKILRMGVGLLIGVWIARYLGPEQFGLLNFTAALIGLFGALAGMGLQGIVVREIVQDPAYQNFTIDALAREVGFSSRQHLNKPFKKFHGGNPSDLIDATIAS